MVKFVQYINEAMAKNIDGILEKLRKDCAPFLKEIKGAKNLLWRGVRKPMSLNSVMVKRRRRKRRRPLSTNPELHRRLDKLFYEKFGWKPRSQGVFVTQSYEDGRFFASWEGGKGDSYIFFPIGSYTYLWNPKVGDLYGAVKMNSFDDKVQSVINGYQKNGLKKVMSLSNFSGREVMFDVDNYYLVAQEYEKDLVKALL